MENSLHEKRHHECPYLHFNDVFKRDVKALNTGPKDWEMIAEDLALGNRLRCGMKDFVKKKPNMQKKKRNHRKNLVSHSGPLDMNFM